MNLSYRNIKPDEQYAEQIWNVEQTAPQWFRDASSVWHKSFDAFLNFWRSNCGEIFGLFDGEELRAVVYLEFLSAIQFNVHVSIVGRVAENDLVRWFESLKRQKAIEGYTIMQGWLVARNRGLIRIAEKAGFLRAGCKMDYGECRWKVIRWVQVRA